MLQFEANWDSEHGVSSSRNKKEAVGIGIGIERGRRWYCEDVRSSVQGRSKK